MFWEGKRTFHMLTIRMLVYLLNENGDYDHPKTTQIEVQPSGDPLRTGATVVKP